MRYLARRLGVPLGATLAVGDQWNDVEMLAEVGHGAAMPTAPAGVRAVGPLRRAAARRRGRRDAHRGAGARRARGRATASRAAGGGGRSTRRRRRHDRARRRRTTTPDGREAVAVLRGGGVVALPTDTVYGIGVALRDAGRRSSGCSQAKRRPPDKGIMLLLDDAGPGRRDRRS